MTNGRRQQSLKKNYPAGARKMFTKAMVEKFKKKRRSN
jgi:hypothetical protein